LHKLTFAAFDAWLSEYSRASIENDPQASAHLFAEDASYYESPFSEPLVGREAIYSYWAAGAERFTDKQASHKILALWDNVGVAQWRSQFVVRAGGETVALDCIFVVEFDDAGKATLFREWWHSQRQ
jgi:ketosteroid isomerase-like protein